MNAWANRVEYFRDRRRRWADLYHSERLMLTPFLRPNLRVLDIGCALGGLADALGERAPGLDYTGVDSCPEMLAAARGRRAELRFAESVHTLGRETFDLVVCLGVLHLDRAWRSTLAAGWARTAGAFVFDLREGGSNQSRSEGQGASAIAYTVLSRAQAQDAVMWACDGARDLSFYGARQRLDPAQAPIPEALCVVYAASRN